MVLIVTLFNQVQTDREMVEDKTSIYISSTIYVK